MYNQEAAQMDNDRFLTASAVAELTTLSRATIDRKVAIGEFVRPIQLSPRRKAFRESEVLAWMAEKVAA
jgi:predicted DNA-binding transcriptional regulator AlpA